MWPTLSVKRKRTKDFFSVKKKLCLKLQKKKRKVKLNETA